MDRRHVVWILCAAAVAFACGPHPRARVAQAARQLTGAARSGHASAPAPRRPSRSDTIPHVEAALRVVADAGVRFELAVTNPSARRLEIDFPDGQTREFVVLDSAGHPVWRWGSGRLFTQGMQNRPLGAGDSLVYAERWVPAAAGHYTVVARLRSDNYPVTRRVAFTVTPTARLAAR